MGRRKKNDQWDLVKGCVILAGLILWWLNISGLLVPLLKVIFVGIVAALIVALFMFAVKQQRKPVLSDVCPQPNQPSPLPVVSEPCEIDVKCPQCTAALIAPIDMVGQAVTCEGCRHVFEIPKPVVNVLTIQPPNLPKKEVKFTVALLKELEWKRFEQLVEGYFAKSGWKTRPNRIGADGGVDVHLIKQGQPGIAGVVQCKAWNVYTVGVKPVRELFGVMAADGVPEGFFVTTGEYTGEARSFASGKPMTLIDGRDLLKRLELLPPEAQADLYARVTAGDYTTPTCPQCGIKMVRREAGKGRSIGNEFWGCPKYPRCRQTFQIKKDAE